VFALRAGCRSRPASPSLDRSRPRRASYDRDSLALAARLLVREPSGRVRLEADQLAEAHDLIAPCLAPADSCLLEITGRDQQSKTDQQMSFRNR
jgi:hypothetical protein